MWSSGTGIANSGPTQGQMSDMGGIDRLGAAMLMAAVAVMPAGLGQALAAIARPLLLPGAGVGVCSSVIADITDRLTMARLPRPTFALLVADIRNSHGRAGTAPDPHPSELGRETLVAVGVALHRRTPFASGKRRARVVG